MNQDLNTLFSPIVENAIRLSAYWHKGQMRKGGEFEYFTHPTAVGIMLARASFSEEIIAAGFCHDLLEDTRCPAQEIKNACGLQVLDLVLTLTEDKNSNLKKNWELIKQEHIQKIKEATWQAKAVFVADKIHNLQTLMAALEEHGMTYFNYFHRGPEQKLWIEDHRVTIMQNSWQHPLIDEYDLLVNELVDLLEQLDIEMEKAGKQYKHQHKLGQKDFDEPEIKTKKSVSLVKKNLGFDYEALAKITHGQAKRSLVKKGSKPKKPKKTLGKYLNDNEFRLLLPVVLKLGIEDGQLTNPGLQDHLGINYLTAYKILKELKKLHVIKRADSFKPRKVNKTKSKEVLAKINKLK